VCGPARVVSLTDITNVTPSPSFNARSYQWTAPPGLAETRVGAAVTVVDAAKNWHFDGKL